MKTSKGSYKASLLIFMSWITQSYKRLSEVVVMIPKCLRTKKTSKVVIGLKKIFVKIEMVFRFLKNEI